MRIAAQTGFAIDGDTERAVREQAGLLSEVSPERVREELLTILSLPGVGRSLEMLDALWLLDIVLPELAPARGVTQPVEHHWDVFHHTLHCVDFAEQVLDGEYRSADPAASTFPGRTGLTTTSRRSTPTGTRGPRTSSSRACCTTLPSRKPSRCSRTAGCASSATR